MLLKWLRAQDAVDAGAALADSFPARSTGDVIREFFEDAAEELRARKLNFYKRVRFANAFRWRLLEKGLGPETAHDITQTLLINLSSLGSTEAATPMAAAAAPRPADASASVKSHVSHESLNALLRRANEAAARNAHTEAVALFQEYTAARPKDAAGFNNLGATLTVLGRYEEARKQLHTALRLAPRSAAVMYNKANLSIVTARFADAENHVRRAAEIKPADPLIRVLLGDALMGQGRLEKARIEYEKALKATPRCAAALAGLGTLERSSGHFPEAEQYYRRALEIDPDLISAWTELAGCRRMTAADSGWLADAERVASKASGTADEANLRFAIGKCYDDLGQYSQAFNSYRRANEIKKPLAPVYDERSHSNYVDDMAAVYTSEIIRSAKAGGSSSARPVFVVGMPRSGTSLAEQILTSHPSVEGVGELEFWADELKSDEARIRKQLLPAQQRQKIAADYLQVLKSRCPDASHVVDKAPLNADSLGLIHSVFPDARIVYMRRDPIDTCLSCYFQNFSVGLNFTFDLNDLAGYYRQHARLMAHWRAVLPANTLLEVPYEALVSDQETWTRRLIAFLGLEWDTRCLKFNENPRAVVTSSAWQVRQRMYGDSVKRWRHYSRFIGPLHKLDPA
jgi:tetratricopeptide (TPR) repeat protein